MKVTLTVVNRSENTDPNTDRTHRNVQLQLARPKEGQDPNAGVFEAGIGGFTINFNGLSEETYDTFRGGQQYEMTLTQVKKVAKAPVAPPA